MDIKDILRTALRQLGKGRGYVLLNIAGLAAGITCCLLIFEYVAFERSYDRWNPLSGRIVRIQDEEYQNGKLIVPCASAMPNLAPLMIKDFPEVETACRLYKSSFLLSSHQGVYTFTRPTRNGREKGIDVRIALDVIRMAHRNQYDVAIIFSQDQDLSEAANEIRTIASEQQRWIKIACAFPSSEHTNKRGINSTDWIQITKATYDRCIDPRDYRPRSTR